MEANQTFYLGCVFAVIREWVAQGKQRTTDTRHDFREWTQSLDWIVQSFFALPPLLDGHQEIQTRVANLSMQWLRSLAHAILAKDCMGKNFTAMEIGDFCEEEGIDIPGRGKDSQEKVHFSVGRMFKKLFKDAPTMGEDSTFLILEDIKIIKKTEQKYEGETIKTSHLYSFSRG